MCPVRVSRLWIILSQSQRCISPWSSNHGILPNDSVNYSDWPLPVKEASSWTLCAGPLCQCPRPSRPSFSDLSSSGVAFILARCFVRVLRGVHPARCHHSLSSMRYVSASSRVESWQYRAQAAPGAGHSREHVYSGVRGGEVHRLDFTVERDGGRVGGANFSASVGEFAHPPATAPELKSSGFNHYIVVNPWSDLMCIQKKPLRNRPKLMPRGIPDLSTS